MVVNPGTFFFLQKNNLGKVANLQMNEYKGVFLIEIHIDEFFFSFYKKAFF